MVQKQCFVETLETRQLLSATFANMLGQFSGLLTFSLTFALPPRFQIFSAGFQGCSLPSVVRSRHKRVVETYPLEPPTADLR